jgi:hypothetical protein
MAASAFVPDEEPKPNLVRKKFKDHFAPKESAEKKHR